LAICWNLLSKYGNFSFSSLEIWLCNIFFFPKKSLVEFALHFLGCLVTKIHQKKQHWFQWSHKRHRVLTHLLHDIQTWAKKHWHNLEGCYNIFLLGGTTNKCWPILSFPMLLMDFRIFTFFRFIEKKHESKKKEKKESNIYLWIWCHRHFQPNQRNIG